MRPSFVISLSCSRWKYLKIARALSSSEVQYLTSTLTRLENVWYSVLAAWNNILDFVNRSLSTYIVCQCGDFTKNHLFCCFVDSFKDIHIVLVHVLLLVFWRSDRRRLPARQYFFEQTTFFLTLGSWPWSPPPPPPLQSGRPPSLWWTPLKLSSPLATSQMMMGGWLVGVAVADQERNWLLIEWELADQNWIGDWSWFWRPAPSFQKVSNNYSFWITFCQNCLRMVVWWQRGGAAHSANEQEGRKGGKVSILTLAAFMFGFYIQNISVLLDYRRNLTNTSKREKCLLVLHFNCWKLTDKNLHNHER